MLQSMRYLCLGLFIFVLFFGCSETVNSPEEINFSEKITVVAPATPTGFFGDPHFVFDTNQDIKFEWDESQDPNVTGYKIYRRLDGYSSYSLRVTINSRTTTEWTDTGILWGIKTDWAAYKISAVDANNGLESELSSMYFISYEGL